MSSKVCNIRSLVSGLATFGHHVDVKRKHKAYTRELVHEAPFGFALNARAAPIHAWERPHVVRFSFFL